MARTTAGRKAASAEATTKAEKAPARTRAASKATAKRPAATRAAAPAAKAPASAAKAVPAARTSRAAKPAASTKPATKPEATAAVVRPKPAHAAIPGTGGQALDHPLRNMSEIRHYFRTSMQQVFFVGATAFNLLGLDRWVRGFSYIVYYDGWDGAHQNVFSPIDKPYIEFQSGEEINNWLLRNAEVRAHIAQRTPRGMRPQVAMVFFDEETEQICDELGYDLILPPAALRDRLDSKLVTTRLGEEVGAHSVPNVLATVNSWDDVVAAAATAGLGEDLVIQTAYGDSGKTTFFVAGEKDFAKIRGDVEGTEVKIMKRINNRPIAVEAVLTRHGTVVGPFMTEITGQRALTPYRGGWSGNEMFPDVLDDDTRREAAALVRRLGDRLGQEGYRGFFEVDVLIDTDTGTAYLGELNPRISGASAVTNVTAGAYADVPLFVFHLLEYAGVDFDLDVDEINTRWDELAADDEWSTMIIKHTAPTVDRIDVAPPTGRYVVGPDGALRFARFVPDWHLLTNENEAFYLRVYGPGDYRWKGADMGILVTKGRMQTKRGTLTIRARQFIDAIRDMYTVTPLDRPEPAAAHATTASKGL